MTHNAIQKKLLLYLDGGLSEPETAIVQEHLTQCRSCEKEIQALSAIWNNEDTVEKIVPPNYLWTKLEARLYPSDENHLTSLIDKLVPAARFSLVAALMLAAIFMGSYIGNVSNDLKKNDLENTSGEYFWNTYNLDSLEPIPAESIGKVFTLALNDEVKGVAR